MRFVRCVCLVYVFICRQVMEGTLGVPEQSLCDLAILMSLLKRRRHSVSLHFIDQIRGTRLCAWTAGLCLSVFWFS